MSPATLALTAACLFAGMLLGALYFWSLWRGAMLLSEGGGALTALLYAMSRWGLLAALFGWASSRGALPLLAAALGVLLVRAAALRRAREIPR